MTRQIDSDEIVNYAKTKGFDCEEIGQFFILTKPQQSQQSHHEFIVNVKRERQRTYTHNDEQINRSDIETVTVTIMVPKWNLGAWLRKHIKKLIDDS